MRVIKCDFCGNEAHGEFLPSAWLTLQKYQETDHFCGFVCLYRFARKIMKNLNFSEDELND
jgi:hypothetical protein